MKTKTAAGLGFEPRFRGPEPRVLPLDDPAIFNYINSSLIKSSKFKIGKGDFLI